MENRQAVYPASRREFLTLLGGAVGAWPTAASAQRAVVPEIGILNSISFGPIADRLDAFLERLKDGGFVDGETLTIAYRSADGQAAWLPILAADLVRRNSRVIVCLTSANAVRAAMATTSI